MEGLYNWVMCSVFLLLVRTRSAAVKYINHSKYKPLSVLNMRWMSAPIFQSCPIFSSKPCCTGFAFKHIAVLSVFSTSFAVMSFIPPNSQSKYSECLFKISWGESSVSIFKQDHVFFQHHVVCEHLSPWCCDVSLSSNMLLFGTQTDSLFGWVSTVTSAGFRKTQSLIRGEEAEHRLLLCGKTWKFMTELKLLSKKRVGNRFSWERLIGGGTAEVTTEVGQSESFPIK